MHIKRHSIIILFFLFLFSPLQILASEEPIPTLYDGINLEEENITAQNLGVDEQNILPGDTLYLFKNIWRRFKTAITFDKIKKAELKLQHANERIIEAQNLVDGGVAAEAEKYLSKTLVKYEKDLENIQEIISNTENKIEDNPKLDKFIDKLADSQIKQQKLIQKLEDNVPEKALKNIKQARQNSTKHFAEVILQTVPQEQIAERIEKAIEAQTGGEFKNFNNLKILKQIRENLPAKNQKQFKQAEDKILEKLDKKIQKLDDKKQKELKKYLEKNDNNTIHQLKVLNKLQAQEIRKKKKIIMDEESPEAIEARIKKIQEYTKNLTPERQKELKKRLEQAQNNNINQQQGFKIPVSQIMQNIKQNNNPIKLSTSTDNNKIVPEENLPINNQQGFNIPIEQIIYEKKQKIREARIEDKLDR